MSSDTQMQEFLSAATDAVLRGESNLERLAGRYDMPPEVADDWQALLTELNHTLMVVQPSARFENQLKAELMGRQPVAVRWPLKRLPVRVQVAALLTLVGGFLLLLRNRFVGGVGKVALTEKEEARAAR